MNERPCGNEEVRVKREVKINITNECCKWRRRGWNKQETENRRGQRTRWGGEKRGNG